MKTQWLKGYGYDHDADDFVFETLINVSHVIQLFVEQDGAKWKVSASMSSGRKTEMTVSPAFMTRDEAMAHMEILGL